MGGRDTPLRTHTIGRHGAPWTTELARRKAIELLGQVKAGVDHSAERLRVANEQRKGAAARESRSFATLSERWFLRHVKRNNLRSVKDIEGVLRRDLQPAFIDKTIDEMTKIMVTEMIDNVGDRSPDGANKAFKWLRQMFNWFEEKGLIASSPLNKMKMPFPELVRTRTLSLPEVIIVWIALDKLPEPFRSFYRLLILSGQRLREVSNMPWAELDIEFADWTIPQQRTKNKREHVVPLPEQALHILEDLQPNAEKRNGPVFTTNGRVGISGFSKLKEWLDEAVDALIESDDRARMLMPDGLANWVVHDLRRSLATGCQGLGIPIAVTEAVINHISGSRGGIVRIYQVQEYYNEKADALQRWADLIDEALSAWRNGDIESIRNLDPSRRTTRRRRTKNGGHTTDSATATG